MNGLADLSVIDFGAGAAGAFGTQLTYWTNVLRRGNPIRPSLIFTSFLFVITGAFVALFFGVEFESPSWAVAIGACWPKAIELVFSVFETMQRANARVANIASGRDNE